MNTQPAPLATDEYRASMQAAALGFLQRHQAEHLTDDGALFDRAVNYLVQAMDVPLFMAPRLAHLAMSELVPVVIGIDRATGPDATVITHVHQGMPCKAFAVPRRILPTRFQPH